MGRASCGGPCRHLRAGTLTDPTSAWACARSPPVLHQVSPEANAQTEARQAQGAWAGGQTAGMEESLSRRRLAFRRHPSDRRRGGTVDRAGHFAQVAAITSHQSNRLRNVGRWRHSAPMAGGQTAGAEGNRLRRRKFAVGTAKTAGARGNRRSVPLILHRGRLRSSSRAAVSPWRAIAAQRAYGGPDQRAGASKRAERGAHPA